uniref:Acyltransferase 3 domain-containing protein n=1 Tax=Panagrolaimus sp. PS1159 TaxID=55785 RepID=A0AC35FQZ6_9BILA
MVYLGDISYALYLIHWPLITYMKYSTIDGKLNVFDGILAGLSSTMFAVFLHETIEKPLIKHVNSVMKLICLFIIAYSLTFCYIPSHSATKEITFSPITQKFISDVNNFSNPMELPSQWTQQNDIEFAHYIKK